MSDVDTTPGGRTRTTSSSSKEITQQSQGLQLLPLLTKHYKTALLLLLVWFVGYLGLSTTWVLIGFFFHVVNEEFRRKKDAKRLFAQEAATNEKQAILARVDELPAWVYFPDIERAEWLNKMIKQMWPYIGDYVKKLLHETIEPVVDNSLPGMLKPFKFEHIDLGDTPPRIGGVKVYADNVRRDEVIIDLEIFYAGDAEIKVAVRGMNAGIKHITIHGIVRVIFKPLVPVVPLIGGMNVFFLNQPSVDFDLTDMANVLDTPVLSNSLRTVLEDLIAGFLVLPNKIPIKLVDNIDVNQLKFPLPQGVLRLHIIAGRELLKADNTLFGSSDPYAKVYVGAQTFQTQTIKNNLNPVWNKYFEAVVDQKHGQVVELEVLDEDKTGKDDELGTASVDIENIATNGSMDSWLPLENVKTGMIHIRALWFHLSKDPEDLERIGKTLTDGLRPGSEEHLATALLMVTVDSAKSLPVKQRGKKSMSEPSPYINVGVGNVKKKSMMKPKTTDPRWEENFQFMVHNPKVQELYLEVIDSAKSDKKLGYVDFPIKNLLTAKDLTVHRPFQLKDSGPNSRVTLRMCLRLLTSEMPADWALDPVATSPEEKDATEHLAETDEADEEQAEDLLISNGLETNIPDKNFTLGGDSDAASNTSSQAEKSGMELRHRGSSSSSTTAPFGKIQLTLRYSVSRSRLVLVVHQCINLIACDDDNLSDPYIRIYMLPERSSSGKKKTQVSKNNLNPIYDETFEWGISQTEATTKSLDILVKNSTGFLSRSQKQMGQLFIDLAHVPDLTISSTKWYDLFDPESDKTSVTSA